MTCALEFLAAIVAIVLTINYRLENKRRDSKYGTPHPNATVDTSELADQVRAYAMNIILQRRGLTVEVGSGLPLRTLTEFDEAGDDCHDENDLIHYRDDISGCCTSVSYCKAILLLRLRIPSVRAADRCDSAGAQTMFASLLSRPPWSAY